MDRSIIELLGSISLSLLAAVVAFAALAKAIGLRDFAQTLERLGVKEAHTRPVALGVSRRAC